MRLFSVGEAIIRAVQTKQTNKNRERSDPASAGQTAAGTKTKQSRERKGRRYEVGPCYWRSEGGRDYFFRAPTVTDGAEMWRLARDSGMLEVNTPYSYLLLAQHFADTCVVAERGGEVVGFVSAFVSPSAHDTVFVWQVGVAHEERGQGVAKKLLHHLLARPACRRVRRLEATVTPSNTASRALFESVARDLDVPFTVYPGFGTELFPGNGHEKEELIRIGPLPRAVRGRSVPRAKPAPKHSEPKHGGSKQPQLGEAP